MIFCHHVTFAFPPSRTIFLRMRKGHPILLINVVVEPPDDGWPVVGEIQVYDVCLVSSLTRKTSHARAHRSIILKYYSSKRCASVMLWFSSSVDTPRNRRQFIECTRYHARPRSKRCSMKPRKPPCRASLRQAPAQPLRAVHRLMTFLEMPQRLRCGEKRGSW